MLPESLVLCRLLRRKKMLLPSTIMLGRLAQDECADGTSMLSSSFGGLGVSGTCIFKSYAWTTLSAASTALRELSIVKVSICLEIATVC